MFKPSEITDSLMKAAHIALITATVIAQIAPFLPGDGYYFLSFFSLAMPFFGCFMRFFCFFGFSVGKEWLGGLLAS